MKTPTLERAAALDWKAQQLLKRLNFDCSQEAIKAYGDAWGAAYNAVVALGLAANREVKP